MKRLFTAAIFMTGFLGATYALGQIYDDRHADIIAPMDRAAEEHFAIYANVGAAGEELESLSEEERYVNMTEDTNAANERHFNVVEE